MIHLTRLCVMAALLAMSATAAAKPQAGPRNTIAVAGFGLKSDFEATYGSTEGAGGLAAMLSTALEQTGEFVVIERTALSDVFAEQELTAAGLVRSESAATPGELIGARILVMGQVTEFTEAESGGGFSLGLAGIGSKKLGIGLAPSSSKGVVGIDVRLVDATTSQLLATFNVREEVKGTSFGVALALEDISLGQKSFQKSALGKAARKAIDQVVSRVVKAAEETPWSGRVVDVEASEVVINAGGQAGIAVGERYQIHRVTKVLRDPASGRILGERKQRIGEITIFEVADEMAFGKLSPDASDTPKANDLVTVSL